ncbi:hypothetical protein C4577_02915 [Candidatus Parcubacteria bacterium]|nr:MAG: hypothetical protein C4577_02915 [Candidatus Parcubacteria bacterium]
MEFVIIWVLLLPIWFLIIGFAFCIGRYRISKMNVLDIAKEVYTVFLQHLTDQQRRDFISELDSFYCRHCGRKWVSEKDNCHCWRDE